MTTEDPAADSEEIWRDIPQYEGRYQVSDLGGVRSVDRTIFNRGSGGSYSLPGRILLQTPDPDGYLGLSLCGLTSKVHRLVLLAFEPIQNPENFQVDHINGTRCDNRLRNLRWVSAVQNKHNLHGPVRSNTGHRGVYYRPTKKNPWHAVVNILGRQKSLGHYSTLDEAIDARRKGEREHYV